MECEGNVFSDIKSSGVIERDYSAFSFLNALFFSRIYSNEHTILTAPEKIYQKLKYSKVVKGLSGEHCCIDMLFIGSL